MPARDLRDALLRGDLRSGGAADDCCEVCDRPLIRDECMVVLCSVSGETAVVHVQCAPLWVCSCGA